MFDDSVLTSVFPGEVITRALVRDVQLPAGAGTMALITLDNGHDHTRPNTFGPAGLIALRDALDEVAGRAETGDIAAVGVTGKPFIFAAGADLAVAALIRSRDEALAVGGLGHDVLRRFGELGVPSFAFVNGAALGGGLELALHCSYRTISSGVTAVAFPECFLGLLPGWGGTYLLPRLIGPEKALKVIIENPLSQNRMLTGPQAFSLGIADAMFPPADFLAESLRWAARVLTDLDQARLEAGVGHVHGEIAKLASRGRISADAAAKLTGLVTGSLTQDAFADADFVIEAVFEELSVKRQVFAEVEAVVRPDCLLATNTSSLSVTEMAAGLAHPSRVVGFHFFNPVAMMPLVEVIRTARTDDAALATALAVGQALKKNCVLVKDSPAFVVNRLLTRFLSEITACVDEGTPFDVAEHATDALGLPMPPFLLLQLVGPAVALHVTQTLAAAYPDRFATSPKLRALVEAGKTAVYRPDFSVDPAVAAILAGGDRPSTTEQVRERALEALADEIRLMLDEAVVAAPEDIDLCMILGAGWPFHLGGITPYLDRSGIAEKVTGTRFRI